VILLSTPIVKEAKNLIKECKSLLKDYRDGKLSSDKLIEKYSYIASTALELSQKAKNGRYSKRVYAEVYAALLFVQHTFEAILNDMCRSDRSRCLEIEREVSKAFS